MQTMGRSQQWGDEELTAFYQHYHNTTQDWDKVCTAMALWHKCCCGPTTAAESPLAAHIDVCFASCHLHLPH